jgi:hypothetical protein
MEYRRLKLINRHLSKRIWLGLRLRRLLIAGQAALLAR